MVHPYIVFNGNCREALAFYAEVFGAQPRILTFGEGKEDPQWPMPGNARDLVMFAELLVEGSRIMFSDLFPGMPYAQGNHMSLAVVLTDRPRAEELFKRLSESGQIEMELQDTEWSGCYGSLIDKYGIGWQINLEA